MKSFVSTLVLGLGLLSGTANAAHTLDELSASLVTHSQEAAREVNYGFRKTPQYAELSEHMAELYGFAAQIRTSVVRRTNYVGVQQNLAAMDELFHHVEELVDEVRAASGRPTAAHFGYGHAHFHPGVSQFHLKKLDEVLACMADLIHEMQDLVAPLCTVPGPPRGVPVPTGPVYVPGPTTGMIPAPGRPYRSVDRGIQIYKTKNGGVGFSLILR